MCASATLAVASVDPSSTTISSSARGVTRAYSVIARNDSPMRSASLNAGTTTETSGARDATVGTSGCSPGWVLLAVLARSTHP
jgi:hypothetical protein